MQRVLKFFGVLVTVGIGFMLWFWLLFGSRRVVCGDAVRSMFVAGSEQFAVLAGLWGLLIASLIVFKLPRPVAFLLWAFGLGSFFHVFHRFSLGWLAGINLSLSALVAIVITQLLTLIYLHRFNLAPRDFKRAAIGWGSLTVAGLLGVAGTELWLTLIPCRLLTPEYENVLTRVALDSISWYVLCGALPSLITALLYANEMQPSR